MPWGISPATGLILTLLYFGPSQIRPQPIRAFVGMSIPSKTQIAEIGEIPVDVIDISFMTAFAGEWGNDQFGGPPKPPNPQKAK